MSGGLRANAVWSLGILVLTHSSAVWDVASFFGRLWSCKADADLVVFASKFDKVEHNVFEEYAHRWEIW